MTPDPDYRIRTYLSQNADAGKEWLARADHPRSGMMFYFDGATEAEVITQASDWWEKYRIEREKNWARKDAAKKLRGSTRESSEAAEIIAADGTVLKSKSGEVA